MQKIKKATRRPEKYDPLLRHYERFNQTAFLLAPEKVGTKGRAQAATMGYLLNWYPYRQQCGKIGEWNFASHEKLARKNAITVRQSQEAVAVLKRYAGRAAQMTNSSSPPPPKTSANWLSTARQGIGGANAREGSFLHRSKHEQPDKKGACAEFRTDTSARANDSFSTKSAETGP